MAIQQTVPQTVHLWHPHLQYLVYCTGPLLGSSASLLYCLWSKYPLYPSLSSIPCWSPVIPLILVYCQTPSHVEQWVATTTSSTLGFITCPLVPQTIQNSLSLLKCNSFQILIPYLQVALPHTLQTLLVVEEILLTHGWTHRVVGVRRRFVLVITDQIPHLLHLV